ncbi:endo-1,4-beta-xylanase [Altererythrobacter sp. ZODW24]|uniref:endo-1,4-beta-xylanase n=1 Tax=Altererythrobacter sp. ZODW24 TaxID=2185142 RepID=UPI000DF8238A|nr:endo-1,4-beta-xylanase [Altererythrobacter sp. ZODW24]
MAGPFEVDRRSAMAGLSTLALAGCGGAGSTLTASEDAADASLDTLAKAKGRRFGSAVSWSAPDADAGSVQNPDYAKLLNAECGMVVPENEMKWQAIRPGPDSYDFSRMDDIVRWAKTNGQEVRGHTLLWHRPEWFPDWLNTYDFGANPRAEAERLLASHIRTVTDRYDGVISSYDVVNEAIDHDTNAPIETSLSRAMGSPEAALDLAFHTAREQLPQGELVYNDYMSWEPAHAGHVADVLRLLEGFKKRGTPVDALGIQSHIEMFELDPSTGLGPYKERAWRDFLDEVTGMGYRLLVTEFDVKDKALPADIAVRDARVADFTRRYFDVMLSYPQLGDILGWGMVDKYNWLQYFDPSKRPDGLEVRGSPYGSDYQSKPMRDAIAASLRGATQAA